MAVGGWLTNDDVFVQPGTSGVTSLTGIERLSLDTQLAGGMQPQTTNATDFMVAGLAASMIYNSGTLSGDTATVNKRSGVILTGSLSTAVDATYAYTIVNSVAAATTTPFQVGPVVSVSNVVPGMAIQSASIATAGTITVTLVNHGTAAVSGTFAVPFQVGASV